MPTPKQQLPRNPDGASLVNSARRRLQYSQLPVRCHKRTIPVSSTPQQQQDQARRGKCLVNSLSRFTPKRRRQDAGCRRSMSMVDLNLHDNMDKALVDLRPETAERLEDSGDGEHRTLQDKGCLTTCWTSTDEFRESRAASLICRAMAINAWRKKRAHVVELKTTVTDLAQQLDHLQLQIVVLRKLLDKENSRVSGLAGELHKSKTQVDELTKERDQLKIDKEAAETEAQRQRDISDERRVNSENLRNELRTARDQLEAVDAQIAKDREKLLKLREDKKILLDKLSSCETLASERASQVEKAELALEDTQVQFVTHVALTNSLQEEVLRYVDLVSEKEQEKCGLEARLHASIESEKALRLQVKDLEDQLSSQELRLIEMESAYDAKVLELDDLQNRLVRQTQESGWSSRVLQLAGSVVRVPRVFLRTLSFFSTGGVPNL